ncbi:MAG: hypothetical protein HY769_01510, partial [Candidatus Stahlbacteria bacterium]|nr:hypothetical protein [Candidatus Stahlbacteria bacterium]
MVILFLLITLDLAELQKALAELGNPWVAGETSVSRLTDEGRANLMGSMTPYLFELGASAFQESYSDTHSSKAPSEWNWRNYKGKNWMTPVKDQLGCGSCYLFAMVGGFEGRLKIAYNMPDTNINLSEEFVLSCCNRVYGCHGGNFPPTAQFVVDIGIPDEKCFPYIGKVLPCINACPDVEARVTKANRWGATNKVAQFKAKLMQGPMACWLTPKSDFLYYKGGVYTPIMGEKYVHAVTLCGWSDSLGAWVFKNSWSIWWGDSGYGWINYGEER